MVNYVKTKSDLGGRGGTILEMKSYGENVDRKETDEKIYRKTHLVLSV